jgi:hypothetical protein
MHKKLVATIQVQSKYHEIQSKTKGKEKLLFAGFQTIESQIFTALVSSIQVKFDSLFATVIMKESQQETINIMKLAGEICTARTKVQLIRAIKNTLPAFFGFESVGVLIRDMKTDVMFTINEIDNEEHDEWMR